VSLALIYVFAVALKIKPLKILFASSIAVSAITIVSYFTPLASLNLPQTMQFLAQKTFTTLGSQLDLVVFLGLFSVMAVSGYVISVASGNVKNVSTLPNIVSTVVIVIALFFSVFNITTSSSPNISNKGSGNKVFNVQLPPFALSWYGAVETLKQPRIAILGAGIDNYSAVIYAETHNTITSKEIFFLLDFSSLFPLLWVLSIFSRCCVTHSRQNFGKYRLFLFLPDCSWPA